MIGSSQDNKKYQKFLCSAKKNPLWHTIRQQYSNFVSTVDRLFQEQPIIPKILHQIWIGPYEFPKEAREWQQTWLDLHPDWEYKLWTNEDLEHLNLQNKKCFDQASNWGEKADILRLEILYRYGGLYVDVDFACLKPFDWLHHTCDFYTGMHAVPLLFNNKLRIANGLIGAKPNHPILKYAVDHIPNFRNKKRVAQRTGPDFFTSILKASLKKSHDNGNIDIIFPANFFYPRGQKGGRGCRLEDGSCFINPESMGAHYYTAYWIRPPGHNHSLTEEIRKVNRRERLMEKRRKQATGKKPKKRRIKKRS